jgi:hypothetical protein
VRRDTWVAVVGSDVIGAANYADAAKDCERNQRIEMLDRGYLVTIDEFDPSSVGPLTISGTWTFDVVTDAGTGTPTVTLKQDGEKLTGHYSSQTLGEADLTDGTPATAAFCTILSSNERAS